MCGSGNIYCGATEIKGQQGTLLLLQDVIVESGDGQDLARVFYDGGSTNILIRDGFAKKLKLKGTKVKYRVNLATKESKVINGYLWEINLVDRQGNKHLRTGYGVPDVMEVPGPVDCSKVRHLFKHVDEIAFKKLESKHVNILIGLNKASLHPFGGHHSKFGCGCF